jgi:hypothetical protein
MSIVYRHLETKINFFILGLSKFINPFNPLFMKAKILFLSIFSLILFSCQSGSEDVLIEDSASKEVSLKAPRFVDIGNTTRSITRGVQGSEAQKKTEKTQVAILKAEYITSGEGQEMGNIVYFTDRGNKQLGADFVPEIQLAFNGTTDLSYYVDDNRHSDDLDVAVTNEAIDRAMNTWDDVTCSELGLTEIPFDGRPTGFVAAVLGFNNGSTDYVADVVHAGWLPADFFDIIAPPEGDEPGGSTFILGVTFTLIYPGWDVDNNGKDDVAWREIYYNDAFAWNDGSTYDVETIALHEAGHGLSQAHFGTLFENRGGFHFAPRAVMNAAYTGVQTSIRKTDNAGHCSNWAEWPNN